MPKSGAKLPLVEYSVAQIWATADPAGREPDDDRSRGGRQVSQRGDAARGATDERADHVEGDG